MVTVESKGSFMRCGTCQFWNGERRPHRSFPLTIETSAASAKGICTNPQQYQLKGKEVEARYAPNCRCYQHWDQMKQ